MHARGCENAHGECLGKNIRISKIFLYQNKFCCFLFSEKTLKDIKNCTCLWCTWCFITGTSCVMFNRGKYVYLFKYFTLLYCENSQNPLSDLLYFLKRNEQYSNFSFVLSFINSVVSTCDSSILTETARILIAYTKFVPKCWGMHEV